MATTVIPITDNHMHVDPRGRGLLAVKYIQNAGGTHIIFIPKSTWAIGVTVSNPGDYIAVFDETVELARRINEIGVGAYLVPGVYPAEISKLTEYMELDRAVELVKSGLELATRSVKKGTAVGIKTGRQNLGTTIVFSKLCSIMQKNRWEGR